MKIYARLDDGVVVEIINPMTDAEGSEIAIERRFHPDFVAMLVDVTELAPPPTEFYTYDGAAFHAPTTS